eukprot:scaffold109073_cov70-Cyclotella_meneghiniana.AAC.2
MLFIKAALAIVTTTFTAGAVNAASDFHSIDYIEGSNTVSRADVLREYGDDINNEPLDVVITHYGSDAVLFHLNANDYVATCSYDDAQTMAFNITGHLVVEDPGIIHTTCPACAEEGCDGAICTLEFLGDEADQFHLRGVALSDERSLLGDGSDSELMGCFSLESTVFVKDKGAISIKDLRIGDMVLSNDQGGYTKYYSILHYLEQAQAEFLRIYTETQVKPLELTYDHMIFREADTVPVPAHSIKVGDVVKTIDGPSKVIDVRKISRKGMFSPFTLSGTIVVDGIISSIHTTMPGFEGTDAGWFYLGDHKLIHWHTLNHNFVFAPHRVICGRFMQCNETLNEEGLTPFSVYIMKFQELAEEKQSTILTLCLLLIIMAQSAIFFLLEILLQHAIVFVSIMSVFVIGRKCLFSKDCNKAKAL